MKSFVVDSQLCIDELKELRALTQNAAGAQRLAFSPVWLQARQWLCDKAATLPLVQYRDAAGNLWFTLEGERPEFLCLGGHMDSVPNGGWLDGCLNVLAGLQVLRGLCKTYAGTKPPISIRLVDWCDEEGARFGKSVFGSSAAAGSLNLEEARHLKDRDGRFLPELMQEIGLDFEHIEESQSELKGALAYLELHIEQGPVLLEADLAMGAVTGTYGVERHELVFHGQAAHSGSTPMHLRRDALLAASRFSIEIYEIAARHAGVCTVGSCKTWPGIPTSVVETCTLTLDQRHLDEQALQRMYEDARLAAQRFADEAGVTVQWKRLMQLRPQLFDPELIAMVDAAILANGQERVLRLPSGPLHDATEVCGAGIPTAMLFVQSLLGISHNVLEDTKEEHLHQCIQTFAQLALQVLPWAVARLPKA